MIRTARLIIVFILSLLPLVGWQPAAGQVEPPLTPTPEDRYSLITFVTDRDDNAEIYIMNTDGSNPVNLSHRPGYDFSPRWLSADGTVIFSADRDQPTFYALPYTVKLDGSEAELADWISFLPKNVFAVTDTVLSPDGTQIAFVGDINGIDRDIYVMNLEDHKILNITDSPMDQQSPDWSPDGTRIAFCSDFPEQFEIWVVDVATDRWINLTQNEASDLTPAWSPDGQKIAFGTYRDGNAEIYVMNANGSNVINLTNSKAGEWQPDWSPDGNAIAFVTDRDGNREIYVMNADGSNQVNLTNHPADDRSPAWSPWLTVENSNSDEE